MPKKKKFEWLGSDCPPYVWLNDIVKGLGFPKNPKAFQE
jgi:hypothetical protein